MINNSRTWYLYILRCNDQSLYTGITTDLERRVNEHNSSKLGAKYTKSRRPVSLVYSEQCQDRSAASKREHQIKKLSKPEKSKLIQNFRKGNSGVKKEDVSK